MAIVKDCDNRKTMKNSIPKISVLVVTYNQEKEIARTIESLLLQRDYIYEVCVSDDCSKDKTWDVLQEYSERYPGFLKLNRNNPNLGIFENIEKSWEMPTGDLVYQMAGDDECGPNWFVSVVEFIRENNIDYRNEDICICGNLKCVYPNGDSIITHRNRNLKLKTPAIRLYERGLVENRSNTFSINILRKFEKTSQGRSYIAENIQACQLYLYVQKFYYINEVGNIYYAGIGVSTKFTDEIKKQHEQSMAYAFDFLKKKGAKLKENDLFMPEFNIAQKRKRWEPTLANYVKYWNLRRKVFDFSLYFYSLDFKAKLFAIARRLPHRKSINW